MEQAIHFPPTYRYAIGSSDYNYKRMPSWCDRILWRLGPGAGNVDVRGLYYSSVQDCISSDHKPVIAGFELNVRPEEIEAGDVPVHHAKCCTMM